MGATRLVHSPTSRRRFLAGSLRHGAIVRTRLVSGPVTPRARARAWAAAALAVAAAALVAGCSSSGTFSGKHFTPSTAVVNVPSDQPGKGKPAVTIGTKNFSDVKTLR